MIDTIFGAHARQMIAQPSFQTGSYEVHSFFKTDAPRPVTAADIYFASMLPVLGSGYEQNNPDNVKGPEDRATDAEQLARKAAVSGLTCGTSGVRFQKSADAFVVVFDLADNVLLSGAGYSRFDEEQTFRIEPYEVYLYYPSNCPERTLQDDHLRVIDSEMSLIGNENHEIDCTLDAGDRLTYARRAFVQMEKDCLPKAVAFFTGRYGSDEFVNDAQLAAAIRQAVSALTPAETIAKAVNRQFASPERPATGLLHTLFKTFVPRPA